jgi:hypothetical protein
MLDVWSSSQGASCQLVITWLARARRLPGGMPSGQGPTSWAVMGARKFLAVLSASPDEALATVERLRRLTPRGQTASAGIASWDGTESANALVARADVALYAAKARGRARSEMASTRAAGELTGNRPVGVFRPDAGAEGPANVGSPTEIGTPRTARRKSPAASPRER